MQLFILIQLESDARNCDSKYATFYERLESDLPTHKHNDILKKCIFIWSWILQQILWRETIYENFFQLRKRAKGSHRDNSLHAVHSEIIPVCKVASWSFCAAIIDLGKSTFATKTSLILHKSCAGKSYLALLFAVVLCVAFSSFLFVINRPWLFTVQWLYGGASSLWILKFCKKGAPQLRWGAHALSHLALFCSRQFLQCKSSCCCAKPAWCTFWQCLQVIICVHVFRTGCLTQKCIAARGPLFATRCTLLTFSHLTGWPIKIARFQSHFHPRKCILQAHHDLKRIKKFAGPALVVGRRGRGWLVWEKSDRMPRNKTLRGSPLLSWLVPCGAHWRLEKCIFSRHKSSL